MAIFTPVALGKIPKFSKFLILKIFKIWPFGKRFVHAKSENCVFSAKMPPKNPINGSSFGLRSFMYQLFETPLHRGPKSQKSTKVP